MFVCLFVVVAVVVVVVVVGLRRVNQTEIFAHFYVSSDQPVLSLRVSFNGLCFGEGGRHVSQAEELLLGEDMCLRRTTTRLCQPLP